MEKIIKILEKIRKKNPDAYPVVSLYDIVESRTLNDSIKEIYIEKMLEEISINKKDEIVISNKNLMKKIKQNNNFLSSSALLLTLCVGTLLLLVMSSISLGNTSLGKTFLNTSFVFLIISFFIPLFLIKKGVDEKTKNIENRVSKINAEISQEEYRDIVIKATCSIVEDIEKIDCNPVEKKRLKNHILRLQSYYKQECEKVFYQKLAFVEKDIKNKMIMKKDFNNELLKIRT